MTWATTTCCSPRSSGTRRGEHRGHRLGWWMKAANAGHVLTERPTVRRVHTWNAGENRWMLQINEALGVRHRSPAACWQKLTG